MDIKRTPLYAESWNVAYRMKKPGAIFADKNSEFTVIPNSVKYWAADPMVFSNDGEIYIFAELYDYKLCRGTIGYTKFNGSSFGEWKQVITEDFHMSYPNLFKLNGEIYMIPETSEANELILYKAVEFPDKWVKQKTIISGIKLVDTTLFRLKDGFIAYTEELNEQREDLIYKFDDGFNVLSRDVIARGESTFRCGGRIFEYNNNYVRVCQDCEKDYGKALIFRICGDDLSKEYESVRISPQELIYDKHILLDGMHTYTCIDNMEVIDIKTRRFNVINFAGRIKSKIK